MQIFNIFNFFDQLYFTVYSVITIKVLMMF